MSIYSNLLASEQEDPLECVPVDFGASLLTSVLQASDIHLHPIIEGEDGGSAGAVGPLFYIADGLIEMFPTREVSNRRGSGS